MVLFICFSTKVEQSNTLQDVTWTVAEAEGGWWLSHTTGETVYHIGWHCFRWEKVWTVTQTTANRNVTHIVARWQNSELLFSQLSHDIYPVDGDCILSCKATRKTKLITCTVEQVTGCWWKCEFLGNVWCVHGFRWAGITNFI
jgi:hypothetical protein